MPARPPSPRAGPAAPGMARSPRGKDGEVAPAPGSQAERAARSLAEGLHGRQHAEPFEIQLLEATLDFGAALQVVSAALVPRFADWAFIHLVDEEGIARRVKVAHADAGKAELAEQFRSLAPEPGKATITGQCIRDRAPRLVREVSEHVLRWAAHDHRHYLALKALAPRSLLVVPLLARGRAVGGITLMRAEQVPSFTEADLLEVQKLTVAAALALDNAERFARGSTAPAAASSRAAGEREKRPQRRLPAKGKMARSASGRSKAGSRSSVRPTGRP